MNTIFIGIVQTLIGFLAPIYMVPLVFLIRWDSFKTASGSADDPSFIVRGDLPGWARWAQTMDCRFPGGMYEKAITESLGDGGYWRRLWTSYQWCGLRNRAQGLAYSWGKSADGWIPDPFSERFAEWRVSGQVMRYEREGIWQAWRKVGPVWLVYGWQVYRLRDGTFWAVNHFSAKRV